MQSPSSTARSRTSTASAAADQITDGEFVKRQLKMLAGNYANSALSAEDATTAELYRDEIAAMVKKFGQERVKLSIRDAMRVSKFLPEISVLWERIPPASARHAYDPECKNCGGTGWRMVSQGPGKREAAARCKCLGLRRVG